MQERDWKSEEITYTCNYLSSNNMLYWSDGTGYITEIEYKMNDIERHAVKNAKQTWHDDRDTNFFSL